MACQLIEKYPDFSKVVLVGLQPRGIYLLDRLLDLLEVDYALGKVISGKLDITFLGTILEDLIKHFQPLHLKWKLQLKANP